MSKKSLMVNLELLGWVLIMAAGALAIVAIVSSTVWVSLFSLGSLLVFVGFRGQQALERRPEYPTPCGDRGCPICDPDLEAPRAS